MYGGAPQTGALSPPRALHPLWHGMASAASVARLEHGCGMAARALVAAAWRDKPGA